MGGHALISLGQIEAGDLAPRADANRRTVTSLPALETTWAGVLVAWVVRRRCVHRTSGAGAGSRQPPLKMQLRSVVSTRMADTRSVTVPTAMFNVAAFPAICAKTGGPTQEKRSMKAERVSPLSHRARPRCHRSDRHAVDHEEDIGGGRTVCPQSRAGQERRTIGAIVAGLGVLATGGFFTGIDALLLVGFVGILAAVCGLTMLGMANNPGIQLELSKDQQFVTMKKVHPVFAEATLAMMSSVPGAPPAMYQSMPYQAVPHQPASNQQLVPVGPHVAAPAPVPAQGPAPVQVAPAVPTVMPPASPSDPFRN